VVSTFLLAPEAGSPDTLLRGGVMPITLREITILLSGLTVSDEELDELVAKNEGSRAIDRESAEHSFIKSHGSTERVPGGYPCVFEKNSAAQRMTSRPRQVLEGKTLCVTDPPSMPVNKYIQRPLQTAVRWPIRN
jgi:hypothetical protein